MCTADSRGRCSFQPGSQLMLCWCWTVVRPAAIPCIWSSGVGKAFAWTFANLPFCSLTLTRETEKLGGRGARKEKALTEGKEDVCFALGFALTLLCSGSSLRSSSHRKAASLGAVSAVSAAACVAEGCTHV